MLWCHIIIWETYIQPQKLVWEFKFAQPLYIKAVYIISLVNVGLLTVWSARWFEVNKDHGFAASHKTWGGIPNEDTERVLTKGPRFKFWKLTFVSKNQNFEMATTRE
jgi:hypothetical protein